MTAIRSLGDGAKVRALITGLGQEVRQERGKLLRKAVASSDPKRAVRLLQRLGVDVRREAEKAGVALP